LNHVRHTTSRCAPSGYGSCANAASAALLYSICQASSSTRRAVRKCRRWVTKGMSIGGTKTKWPRKPRPLVENESSDAESEKYLEAETRNVAVPNLRLRICHQPAVEGSKEAPEQGGRGGKADSCSLGHLQSQVFSYGHGCSAVFRLNLRIPDARFNEFVCMAAIVLSRCSRAGVRTAKTRKAALERTALARSLIVWEPYSAACFRGGASAPES